MHMKGGYVLKVAQNDLEYIIAMVPFLNNSTKIILLVVQSYDVCVVFSPYSPKVQKQRSYCDLGGLL